MDIKCVTCNVDIDCKCKKETNIKPKYRSCAMTDGYPSSTLNMDDLAFKVAKFKNRTVTKKNI